MKIINEWRNSSLSLKVLISLTVIFFLSMFARMYFLAYSIDNSLMENKHFLSEVENGLVETSFVGAIITSRPLLSNRRNLFGDSYLKVTGTILELEDGNTIGISQTYDSIRAGTEVRETIFKDTKVYCLESAKQECSFERQIKALK